MNYVQSVLHLLILKKKLKLDSREGWQIGCPHMRQVVRAWNSVIRLVLRRLVDRCHFCLIYISFQNLAELTFYLTWEVGTELCIYIQHEYIPTRVI
jgi:hypothetical protein